ncbi:MAG TPA: UPF0158 family protein [Candidatus Sulfobium mesophilum]|nr:UPF0158 family protein [Candidatus Sulfobium mesophilum]
MSISFDDIENAFLFVNMDQQSMHNAYLCRETGQIFYTSELGDSDELPEDVDDPDKYVTIPHKNDLELGKALVIEFTSTYLPEDLDKVYSIFRSKGAYSRYKDLLEMKGFLDDWYKYENERQKVALKEWCTGNNIEISG